MNLDLDPALEEVLRDLASDPRSTLFAVDPRRAVQALRHQDLCVGAARARLLPAERKLLDVHRAELAYLMRAAWALWLSRSPHADRNPFHGGEPPTRKEVVRRAATWRRCSSSEHSGRDALRLVRWVATRGTPGAARRLITASLRLEDSPTSRIYLAKQLVAESRSAEAARLLRQLLARPLDRRLRRLVFENLGMATFDIDLQESSTAYEEALRLADQDEDEVHRTLLDLLTVALHRGDAPGTRRWAMRLDLLLLPGASPLTHRVALIRKWRGTPRRALPRPEFLARIRATAGDSCATICEAFEESELAHSGSGPPHWSPSGMGTSW